MLEANQSNLKNNSIYLFYIKSSIFTVTKLEYHQQFLIIVKFENLIINSSIKNEIYLIHLEFLLKLKISSLVIQLLVLGEIKHHDLYQLTLIHSFLSNSKLHL